MASEIEEESDLIKIALLADSIRDRLKEQIFRLEQLIKGKDMGGGGGGVKQIKKDQTHPFAEEDKNPDRMERFKKRSGCTDQRRSGSGR